MVQSKEVVSESLIALAVLSSCMSEKRLDDEAYELSIRYAIMRNLEVGSCQGDLILIGSQFRILNVENDVVQRP